MFYLFNSEALLTVPEYKYCVLLLNYSHFRKTSLYGDVVLETLPYHSITCMRILACGSRVSQSISQQTSYITADCWITAMPLSSAVYSLLRALSQRMEGAAFTDLTAEPWRGRGLP